MFLFLLIIACRCRQQIVLASWMEVLIWCTRITLAGKCKADVRLASSRFYLILSARYLQRQERLQDLLRREYDGELPVVSDWKLSEVRSV